MTETLVLRCPNHLTFTGTNHPKTACMGCRRVWGMRQAKGWLKGTFTVVANPDEL